MVKENIVLADTCSEASLQSQNKCDRIYTGMALTIRYILIICIVMTITIYFGLFYTADAYYQPSGFINQTQYNVSTCSAAANYFHNYTATSNNTFIYGIETWLTVANQSDSLIFYKNNDLVFYWNNLPNSAGVYDKVKNFDFRSPVRLNSGDVASMRYIKNSASGTSYYGTTFLIDEMVVNDQNEGWKKSP